MLLKFLFTYIDYVTWKIIVLRPVDDGYISVVYSRQEIVPVDYSPVVPQIQGISGLNPFRMEAKFFRLESPGFGLFQIQ